ncbi:MAG: TonB-dependent receptor [Bacteroidales bacterium]|nr:TonB-dependent receptor [Bacteroidales bacterium]
MLKSKLRTITINLLLNFCLSFIAISQQSFSIQGKVTDQSTGDPLPGASVIIQGTQVGTTTESKGEFRLSNIKQDKITLVISYVGFDPIYLEHDFITDKKSYFTIQLKPTATELEQFKVEAESEGQVKAFIDQKNAANIKNIVSSEQIEKFPDMNAAEAIQRIPGITLQRDQGEGRFIQLRGTPPELTNFNINGEQIPSPEGGVRYVGMDIISADQIDEIEITKVLTPDMDADGIGGTVNITTKRAKSENPEINATVSGGYNNLRKTGNYNLQFSSGLRINKFGIFFNGSYYVNNYGSDNLEILYAKGPVWTNQGQEEENYLVHYKEFQLRYYDITRKRTAISATLDYEFSKNSFVYIRGMFNSFSDDEIRKRKIYETDDPLTLDYYLYGGIVHDVKDRTKIQGLTTVNAGGQHHWKKYIIDYEVAYALATEDTPNRIEGEFSSPGQAIAIKFDQSDPQWPKPYFPFPENSQNAYDYKNYEFDELLIEKRNVKDNNVTAKLNFQIPYLSNPNNSGYIKFGGKYRHKEKERDVNSMVLGKYDTVNPFYPGVAPPMTLPSVSYNFTENDFMGQGYTLEYIPSAEKLNQQYEFYPWFFVMSRDNVREATTLEDYFAREDIYAAYIMLRHDFNKLMILGGLRFEKTDVYNEGRYAIYHPVTLKFIDVDTIPDSKTYEFLLPQFQLKYSFNDNFNLRVAITYTFSRPNFEDMIQYREKDRNEVKLGNPDLIFPKALNIDFLAERYIKGDGIISGGLFYKKVDDFVFYYKKWFHEDSTFSNNLLFTIPVNGIKSYVYGAEIQAQTKLFFLPEIWNNFGFYMNYTFTYSDASIYQRIPGNFSTAVIDYSKPFLDQIISEGTENITLPGQSKHATNLAVFYDTKKIYAKLSANFHDAFLYELGADSDLDEFYDKAWHLDFTGHYAISDHLRIFINLVNLTNQPLKYYLSSPDKILKQEYYSWTGRMGVKLNF